MILAANAAAAILAGTALLGRRPRRPVATAVAGTLGFPLPCLLLALHAPVPAVAAGAAQIAASNGPGPLLGFGAAWSAASSIVVLALPAIRTVTWRD